MKLGILGLPGGGKSTLFDLLTRTFSGQDFTKDPGKPRVKIVKVEDPRLERLRDDYAPKKYTPAALEVYDFPAVPSEERRSGVADLLAPARQMDALFIVLRAFENPGFPPPDPARELVDVRQEFLLADLDVVERRRHRLEEKRNKRSFSDDERKEAVLLEKVHEQLGAEKDVAALDLSAEEVKRLAGFCLLTAKPRVVVLNQNEPGTMGDVGRRIQSSEAEVVVTSARNELEILELPPHDQQVFFKEYGIEQLSIDALIRSGYRAAGRISYFTAGEKEVRAWTIRNRQTAVEAAAEIHSDIARGFIRAEVVSYDDYVTYKSIKGARDKGHLRLEGKEYVMADGDIVEFRFAV